MTIFKATPAARRLARERNLALASVAPTGISGYIQASDVLRAKRYTPLAKAVANFYRLDIEKVAGAGSIIRKSDVLASLNASAASRTVKLSAMRKVIAKRMTSSAQNVPQFTLFGEFDMRLVKAAFEKTNDELKRQGLKATFTDVLIKLAALALKAHPYVNSTFKNDHILLHGEVNIGLAVALDGGLIVPVIRNADVMTLSEISSARAALVKKAREGSLTPEDYQGSTFTISNLGMYPVAQFNPLINEPESGIMGVGRMTDKPVVIDGMIAIRPIIGLSVTFDHRSVDGAEGGKFLATIESMVQDPAWLY